MRCLTTIQKCCHIADDSIASAILFHDRMVAKMIEMRNVLPVLQGASKKYKLFD
jgi:hypothetical protein